MDWKDALASLSGLPEGDEEERVKSEESRVKSEESRQKKALHIVVEKKGRGGKTATIIEGFEISNEEVEDLARTLRKKLGTGGSSRGGEILIQGDRKEDTRRILQEMGYRVINS